MKHNMARKLVNRITLLSLLSLVSQVCMSEELDCTYNWNFCNLDARCLDISEIEHMCQRLYHSPVYEGTTDAEFTVGVHDLTKYMDTKYTITATSGNDNWRPKIVDGCCNIGFSHSCQMKIDEDELYYIHAVLDKETYCAYHIALERKKKHTVWCPQRHLTSDDFPCIRVFEGKVVEEWWSKPAAYSGVATMSEYCFFTAPNELNKQANKTERGRAESNLILDVDDIVMNAATGEVHINETVATCLRRNLSDVNLTEYVYQNLEFPPEAHTWCFFVRAPGFEDFTKNPSCIPCENCTDSCVGSNIFIILGLSLSLTVVIVLCCVAVYETKVKDKFWDKHRTVKENPVKTKELLMKNQEESMTSEKNESKVLFVQKEEDRYILNDAQTLVRNDPGDEGKDLDSDSETRSEQKDMTTC